MPFNPRKFIDSQVEAITEAVGNGTAVNALSGGVDSSVCTLLAHRAIGRRMKTYFVDTGLMREGESEEVVSMFRKFGVKVELVDESAKFFKALKGQIDPEIKRDRGITQTFYKDVFGPLVRKSGAKHLIHGTNRTDVDETVAGVKRQHNILVQLGIDPVKAYGYKVLEPLVELRKDSIRLVGKALGLPKEMWNRPPFPGPGLSVRVLGEVTRERVAVARAADAIVRQELGRTRAFQYLAILHNDKVTGVRGGKREFGHQVEVRCWNSRDARKGTPTRLPWPLLAKLGRRLVFEVPGVVSATYNIAPKPPSTIEGE